MKNINRLNFENKTLAFEKNTKLLRITIIYFLPIGMFFDLLWIYAYCRNEMNFELSGRIILSILFIIAFLLKYFSRKNALLLNKKGYYLLHCTFVFTAMTNILSLSNDNITLCSNLLVYTIFLILIFVYMHKRRKLFINQ